MKILLSLLFCVCGLNLFSQSQFVNNDRVCFVGNSITHGGRYYNYLFLYYATRYPNVRLSIINAGISGDVASGMYGRKEKDVMTFNPTKVVLMSGMNDVNRELYSSNKIIYGADSLKEDALEKYKINLTRLAEFFKGKNIPMIFCSPTIYDENYNTPTESLRGVNNALGACSRFVKKLADNYHAPYIDYWDGMNAINNQYQSLGLDKTIIGRDRVHPDNAGHLIMSYLFLKQIGDVRPVWKLGLDAPTKKWVYQQYCSVSNIHRGKQGLSFDNEESALPFPDIERTEEAKKLIPFEKEINQQTVMVRGLKKGDYILSINGDSIGRYSSELLSRGINIADNTNTPQYKKAAKIYELCKEMCGLWKNIRTFRMMEFWQLAKIDIKDDEAVNKFLYKYMEENKNNIFPYSSAKLYLEKRKQESEMHERIKQIEDRIYELNRPLTYKYLIVKK